MKTIVLINGVARSGKDTFAEMLVPYLCNSDKTGFILPNAFGVKEVASKVYGWNGDKDERGRSLLIDITNTGYKYDSMFWEKYANNHLKCLEKQIKHKFDYVVVPDFRYPITQQYYNALDYRVVTIYVARPEYDNELGVNKYDVSEMPLTIDFDYIVINDSDLENLKEYAKHIAKDIRG